MIFNFHETQKFFHLAELFSFGRVCQHHRQAELLASFKPDDASSITAAGRLFMTRNRTSSSASSNPIYVLLNFADLQIRNLFIYLFDKKA